jgi:ribosomal protein L19E
MEELGIGQNQLGRMNGLTSAAMTQAMRWLRLCPDVQNLLRSIKDHRVIRRLGRRTVFKLLNLPANQQLERIRELMKNDC